MQIDSTHFMQNNLVRVKGSDDIVTIEGFFHSSFFLLKKYASLHYEATVEDLLGIPIDVDILEKIGFIKGSQAVHTTWYHPDMMIFELTQTIPGVGYWKAIRRSGNIALIIKDNFLYLHELQNLFFITTGKVLDINSLG